MAFQILFHPIADKEFGEAYQWYEERLHGLGDRFAAAIEERLRQIAIRPLAYRKKKADYREVKADTFPYVIIYKVYDRKKLFSFLPSITLAGTLVKNTEDSERQTRSKPF